MPINLVNGHLQTPQALAVPNGSITFSLNVDATVVASPYGFVSAQTEVVFQLDASGDILAPTGSANAQIYSNAELNPQNSIGLGTYYLVTFYDQNGAALNQPMWWQFTQGAGTTVDIGEMIPFSTVGGNVIFYPTSFTIPTPGPSSLGGIFSNAGAANEWVSAINTNGTVTLSQPSFSNISGTLSNAQLPSPITFTSIIASGLITAQANLNVGLQATVSGQITFIGLTSGSATITGPAVAGTITNPIAFSNSIGLPSGTLITWNADTGLSRTSSGVLALGTGAQASAAGTLLLTAITVGVAGTSSGVISLSGSTSGAATITAPATAGTVANPIVISNSITVNGGVNIGVAGTLSGVITLEGSTSGSSTITGPATAATVTNPIVFSNAIGIGSAPAATYSTVAGAIQAGYSGAANIKMGDGTNARPIPMNLYKAFGMATVTNPTSLTSILATPTGSSGSLTLVANQQAVGSVVHIHVTGAIVVGATSTVNFSAQLNGGVCTAQAVAAVTTAADSFDYDAWIYCTVVGAASTATMVSVSILKIYTLATLIFTVAPATTSLSATVATTGAQAVALLADFGTGNAGSSITATYAEVEIY